MRRKFAKIIAAMVVSLLFLELLLAPISSSNPSVAYASTNGNPQNLFLPLLFKPAENTLLLGIYPQPATGTDFSDTVAGRTNAQTLLGNSDSLAGKKHSIVGLFADPDFANPDYNFTGQMETIWNLGYLPFVNIIPSLMQRTSLNIASGNADSSILAMAQAYARWVAKGGGRKAILAPLPEMNGYWVSYGKDPGNYKLAFARFRNLFAQAGVPASSVWWAFVPNGYADPGYEFELYYPGDSVVDLVGFSSYNYGFCPVGATSWRKWQSGSTIYDPYINRMQIMAPGKPVIIAQSGTTDQNPDMNTHDHALKDQWLVDAYSYLGKKKGVMAIIYFDFNLSNSGDCDWKISNIPNPYYGYRTAASDSHIRYMSASDITSSNFQLWK